MESSSSTPGPTRSRLPHHLQQPSSSNAGTSETTEQVPGPAVHSSVHNVRAGQSYVTVQTLTKENLVIVVNPKTRVHDVLWKCGEILEIAEDKLFGLALRQATEGIGGDQPRHEYFFLDPAQKIFKYAPKQPRFSNWHSRSTESRPLLVLYFRVRVYIDQVRLITCSRALEHYYLQLKDNFLDQWAGSRCVSEERCWEMAALALKADKGDNHGGFFRPEQYFPMWVIDIRGMEYIVKFMPAASEDLRDMTKVEAMSKFCIEASRSPYALNCHLYGLRRHKMDSVDNAVLGINAKGIEMCDIGENGERVPLRSLQWNKVTRLSFDRKKLTIVGADSTKMGLYAQSESKARYLLELCRAVHQTLLVMSHQTARIAPLPQPFIEKCVDRLSTSSNSGIHEHDTESVIHESTNSGDRCFGSVSSKQRIRVKLDSNLELKIERMELDNIRQERAVSQSSKTSECSERKDLDLEGSYTPSPTSDMPIIHAVMENIRPSSVDSASQTVETAMSRPLSAVPTNGIVDVNFNSKLNRSEYSLDEPGPANMYTQQIMTFLFQPDLQYASSGGSRSDSVQQSQEMIPEIMVHNFYHDQNGARSEDDNDSTMRSALPPMSSISLHDLRPTGHERQSYVEITEHRAVSPSGRGGRWSTVAGMMPEQIGRAAVSQARSEPKIDSTESWSSGYPGAQEVDHPPQPVRLFTKRSDSGANRNHAANINRVLSMPSHYHNGSGYMRSSPSEDYHPQSILQHAQSMNSTRPKTRDPPSYDKAVAAHSSQVKNSPLVLNGSILNGPTVAETPGVQQASFPPASLTPTQFNQMEQQLFMDENNITTDRLREFPMMNRLWKESHGMLGHQRRPSSCGDLTKDFIVQQKMLNTAAAAAAHRGDYYVDNQVMYPYNMTRIPNNSQQNGFTPRLINGSVIGSASVMPNTVAVLPPPPPYPANRKIQMAT